DHVRQIPGLSQPLLLETTTLFWPSYADDRRHQCPRGRAASRRAGGRGPGRDGEPPGGGYRGPRDDLRIDTHGQARAAREVLRWPSGGSVAERLARDR